MVQPRLGKLLPALLFTAFTTSAVHAQLAPYAFSQSTGTYTSIATGTPLAIATATSGAAASLDEAVIPVALQFPFVFNNMPRDTAYVHGNGFLTFGGAAAPTLAQPLGTGTLYTGAVAGQARDLKGIMLFQSSGAANGATLTLAGNTTMLAANQPVTGTNIPTNTTIVSIAGSTVTLSQSLTGAAPSQLTVATGRIDTATLGAAPNRRFVMQWSGFNVSGTALNTFINFQIELAEGGGTASSRTVSVIYGPQAGPSAATTLYTGIRGAYISGGATYSYIRKDTTPVTNALWMGTAAGTNSASTLTFRDTVKPAPGLTFTWAPSGPCASPPTGVAAGGATGSSASVSWTPVSGVASYTLEYGPGQFTPGTGTRVYGVTSPGQALTGLTPGTVYRVYVRSVCSASDSSALSIVATFTTLNNNDSATAALVLTVGSGCTTGQFSNITATHIDSLAGQPYEPNGTANEADGYHTVYFKFAAPAGGAVRLSTDYTGGTLVDTRLAVFSATDSSNYSTFTEIASDEDNGVVQPMNSILYVTGLTPGQTYYAQVGSSGPGTSGSFCITVDSLQANMISTTGVSCTAGPSPFGGNTTYRGWTSLVDATGRLVAMVRQPVTGNTSPGGLSSSLTVHTGSARREYDSTGRFYLNRNYAINWSALNADVRLFFTKDELDSLAAIDGVSTSPAALSVMRQTGSACHSNFDSSAGTEELLTVFSGGLTGGAGWVTFTTPGFSNFYLMGGAVPLSIEGITLTATRNGRGIQTTWAVTGDVPGTRYALQRSADARDYRTLITRNSGAAQNTYLDLEVPAGATRYYRIQATGADGRVGYSSVAAVRSEDATSLVLDVSPNPAKDVLHVRMGGTTQGGAAVSVSDATGRTLYRSAVQGGAHSIDIKNFPAGIYIVRFANETDTKVVKVVKE